MRLLRKSLHSVLTVLLGIVAARSSFCVVTRGQESAPLEASPDRVTRLAERERLWNKAQKLRGEKKLSAALVAGYRVLSIEREVLPTNAEGLFDSLNWLADVAESAGDWKQADALRSKALAWSTEHRGARHWRTIDARLVFEQARKLQSLTVAARAELARAVRLNGDVRKLYGEGRFSDAIASAEQVRNISKQVLGDTHPVYATSLNDLAVLYRSTGDYARAELLYVQARDIRKQVFGETHPTYATVLANLAGLYEGTGDYSRAEPLLVEVLAIRKEVLGLKHPSYAMSLNNLAALYESMGYYARAEPLFSEARLIHKEVLGVKHPAYATSLNNLAGLYMSMGDYARGEPLYHEALLIRREVLGVKHLDYATSLSNLAELYRNTGDYARAEPMCIEALAIFKNVLGEKHSLYARSLNNLATLYDSMGNYARAEPLLVKTLEIRKTVLSERHPDYAMSLNNLASLYRSVGSYARAEPLFVEALKIRRAVQGDKHPDYAMSLNNLASLYRNMGDYARAEPLYAESLKIRKDALGVNHPNYATSLNNLAGLYENMGDFARAEPLYVEAVEIRKTGLGERHPDYAASLNNLALLYTNLGDYSRAEPLFVKAIETLKQVLGERHPDYATGLSNLALLYNNLGDYARAESLSLEALKICKEVLGAEHPDYAVSLSNLTSVYENMGDYVRAEPRHVETIKVLKQALGERHPLYAVSLTNLARLYGTIGDHARAEPLFRQALSIFRRSLESTSSIQSERQQLAMCQSLRHQLDGYVSLSANTGKYARNVFAQVLTWKGATLVRQRGMRLAADDPAAKELLTQLQRTATQLASLSRSVPRKDTEQAAWRTKLSELSHQKELLEAQLSAKSAAFRHVTQEITLDDLLAKLPRDAILVDYLEFNRSTPPQGKGDKTIFERQLVAFVVRHAEKPDDQVVMIPLGAAAPVSASIDAWRTAFGMDPAGAAAGKTLRIAVWQPLAELLEGAQTILVSTDGVLGRLSLGALPGRAPGTYLIEDYRLAMIPVPQLLPTLINATGKRELAKELLLLGDVDYDSVLGEEAAPKKRQPRRAGGNRSPTDSKLFEPLAGAAGEIAVLKDLYSQLFEVKTDDPFVLIKAQADEALFRMLAPQYRHLHLATHGFFAGNQFQSSESATAASLAARRKPFAPTVPSSVASLPAPIVGIGAQLHNATDGRLLVQTIVAGGAAAADGRLKPGDEIRKIGPAERALVDVAGKPLSDAVALIRGSAGTKVRIEVLPKDGKDLIVYELTRKALPYAEFQATRTNTASSASQSSAPIEVVGYNPGLLSGLALAGANLEPSGSSSDGILTAQEIGVLDLSGVDTVVLSACDTGLGETAGGEGLLGVQRAFQVAGAKTTVASLWKVDDLVTRFLMERFYRNLWEKDMTRLDALREAQLHVLKHPDEIRGGDALPNQDKAKARTNPRYWAAFVCSGDWR